MGYSILTSNIRIDVDNVDTQAIVLDVGFVEIGRIRGTPTNSGDLCPDMRVTKNQLSISQHTISANGGCIYALTLENTGTVAAVVSDGTINSDMLCSDPTDFSITCGNVYYRISKTVDGTNLLNTDDHINPRDTLAVYVVITNTTFAAITKSYFNFTIFFEPLLD